MIMSANVGVALMLVARPGTFTDNSMSVRVRDAVHAAVFVPEAGDSKPDDVGEAQIPSAANRLRALLRGSPRAGLSKAESALMTEWLDRVSNAAGSRAADDAETDPSG